MYPVLKEGVSIGTFQYEGSDIAHYYIENADGEEFEISHRLRDALLQADGTRPLNLPNNGSRVLPKLKRLGLVRTSRCAVCVILGSEILWYHQTVYSIA